MRKYNEKNAYKYDYYRSGHILNRKFKQIKDVINEIQQTNNIKNIGEIGGGTGKISYLLAKNYPDIKICCYEKNYSFIKYAKNNYKLNNLNYGYIDIEANNTPEKYNIIITIEMLHHTNHINKVIKNIQRSLLPNGWWLIIEPNIYNFYIFLFQLLAKNEKLFSQYKFEKEIANIFHIREKKYICLIPSYIKNPGKILLLLEKKLETSPILGGSVFYKLKL